MNLLRDAWLPIVENGAFRHATLKEVLCSEADRRLSLPRDDMELAALQLAVCLVQVALPPSDASELRERVARPIDEGLYNKGAGPLEEWFDLRHPRQPFMQTRGVKAKERTPVQKFFVGLPAGNNHSFFNSPAEISGVCPSCAAIALFNQASNSPSFGGGFKGSLRGGAPVTTLIGGENLRGTLWLNVLHRQTVTKLLPVNWGKPVWVEPLRPKEKVSLSRLGLLRGVFWQPTRIELFWREGMAVCESCRGKTPKVCVEFATAKFSYELDGGAAQWPHPHGPRQWQIKSGAKNEFPVSFRKTAPAWTQLSGFLMEHEQKGKEGWVPSPVIAQYREVYAGERLDLIVGGYKNKQAKIVERCHEIYGLMRGWSENLDHIRDFIDIALEIKTLLRNKSYCFGKRMGLLKISDLAEGKYFTVSESVVHALLHETDWKQVRPAMQRLIKDLGALAEQILDEVTQPYRHQPKAWGPYVVACNGLRMELARLRKEA